MSVFSLPVQGYSIVTCLPCIGRFACLPYSGIVACLSYGGISACLSYRGTLRAFLP